MADETTAVDDAVDQSGEHKHSVAGISPAADGQIKLA